MPRSTQADVFHFPGKPERLQTRIDAFLEGNHGQPSMKSLFFANVPSKDGPTAILGKKQSGQWDYDGELDLAPLRETLAGLPTFRKGTEKEGLSIHKNMEHQVKRAHAIQAEAEGSQDKASLGSQGAQDETVWQQEYRQENDKHVAVAKEREGDRVALEKARPSRPLPHSPHPHNPHAVTTCLVRRGRSCKPCREPKSRRLCSARSRRSASTKA